MFCNLGNQIGGPSHGLEPHTSKNIDFWALSCRRGPDHKKVGTGPTFNINTSFQRLRHIDISYGKTISAWAMDWFIVFNMAHT